MKTLLRSLLIGMIFSGAAVASDNIIVILSSNLKPYQDALAGLTQELGTEPQTFVLSEGEPKIPSDTRVVVAIGGKAALYSYPRNTRVIYCLAPGLLLSAENHKEKPIKIHTSPSFFSVVSKFKQIQPSMKRLAVPWISDSINDYLMEKEKIEAELDVQIVSTRLQSSDELPDYLRGLKGKIDALWLPPDPHIISATSFAIVKDFSQANDIPFYSPTDGLTEQGAVASVSSSFGEIGRTAAHAVTEILTGAPIGATIYPKKMQVSINTNAAKESKMTIPAEAIKAADRTIP